VDTALYTIKRLIKHLLFWPNRRCGSDHDGNFSVRKCRKK